MHLCIFVYALESFRFPSSDALSGLGLCGLVLHFNGLVISIPKFIIYIRFASKPNQGVTLMGRKIMSLLLILTPKEKRIKN